MKFIVNILFCQFPSYYEGICACCFLLFFLVFVLSVLYLCVTWAARSQNPAPVGTAIRASAGCASSARRRDIPHPDYCNKLR